MSQIKSESGAASGVMDVSPIAPSTLDSAHAPEPTPPVTDSTPSLVEPKPLTSMSLPTTTTESPSTSASIASDPLIQQPSPPQLQPTLQTQSSISSINGASSNSNSNSTRLGNGATASALDRGPLGLTVDEEQWVKEKMEYALHDFQVLSLAIKRYKWQLSQVPKDVDRLQNLKEKHMKDPFEFLQQLKSKAFRYPESQKTLPAPSIEWTKYQFPPANPVVPTKTPRATYLSSVSFSTNRNTSNANIVTLGSHSSNTSRSRAGSPSERRRVLKETAKSLGINTIQHHYPAHQHHYHHHHPSNDAEIRDIQMESNGADARHSSEFREPSQQALREQSQPGSGLSPSVAIVSQDMEGITYPEQGLQTTAYRPESAPNTQIVGVSSFIPTPQSQIPIIQSTSEPVNLTIDHSLGYNPIQPNDFGNNSNITYNHMSGSVDVQPGNALKPRGSSREGSGVRDDPKPPLYNIPWSDEEQQLLEKLLDYYPDEPVAAQRFQKISAAMGTRTPKQVASRVQKYFIKLVKAGLEAPGRMNYSLETSKSKNKGVTAATKGKKRKDVPGGSGGGNENPASGKVKVSRLPKKITEAGTSVATTKKKQKAKSLLGSGFGRTSGTQYLNYTSAPTVYMSDEDDEESVQDMLGVSSSSISASSNVLGSSSHRGSPDGGIATHIGYTCDSCGVDPILGIRYSCMDCEELGGTDLCGPCYNSGEYQNELHLLSHRFQAIETADVPAYSHDYRSSSAGPSGTSGIYHAGK